MKTSDLVKMAKGKKTTGTTIKKIVAKKVIEPIVKTEPIEEDRDTKAKKTIEKLMEGISFNPNDYKSKEIDNIEEDSGEEEGDEPNENNSGSNEWLEQQVTELTQMNEYLRNQLASNLPQNNNYTSKDVALEDNNVKLNVVKLFMELQSVYMNVGFNYTSGAPRTNMIINPEQFMVRLLDFFPFLEEYRKIPLQ